MPFLIRIPHIASRTSSFSYSLYIPVSSLNRSLCFPSQLSARPAACSKSLSSTIPSLQPYSSTWISKSFRTRSRSGCSLRIRQASSKRAGLLIPLLNCSFILKSLRLLFLDISTSKYRSIHNILQSCSPFSYISFTSCDVSTA